MKRAAIRIILVASGFMAVSAPAVRAQVACTWAPTTLVNESGRKEPVSICRLKDGTVTQIHPCTALMRNRSSAMHRRSERGAQRSAREGVGCRAEPDQDVVVQRSCESRDAVRTTLILHRNDYAADG